MADYGLIGNPLGHSFSPSSTGLWGDMTTPCGP